MLVGGSSPLPSPGSVCGPAAAEEETKDNEGQVKFLTIYLSNFQIYLSLPLIVFVYFT